MADIYTLFGIALILSLVVSSVGFYRLVYFISIGYGYSVAAIAVGAAVFASSGRSAMLLFHSLFLTLYGIRLGTYLVLRERRSSFAGEKSEIERQNAGFGFGKKLAIWLPVALLYVSMTAPLLFHATAIESGLQTPFPTVAGILIGFAGLAIETIADAQKSRQKRLNPDRFADSGLYRLIRYPNYFGEMLVWLGNWIAGIPFYRTPFAWIVSIIGLVVIELIMLGSGKRLEEKQDARYGSDLEYRTYRSSVPAIFPLIPLYSLKRIRIYLG